MTTTTKATASSKPNSAAKDAIALLKADHETVSGLFAEYEKTRSVAKKKALVAEICTELSVHAQIEEEIFYPKVEGLEPDGEMYDAKVKVLSEYVKHHVKEEQNEMFPKAKATSLDLVELGARMTARKAELLASKG